ncbi:MAG: ABC transporter permease [Verrucomicrobia bacterium]|nr:ABC transporter permease [Verrucomicrobiota bacterium]
MNSSSNNTPEPSGGNLSAEASAKADDPGYSSHAPGYSTTTRPFYWSVWRELWENRSIYVAPLIVAIVVLFGFLISTIGLPERRQQVLLFEPAKARAMIAAPYDGAAIMLIFTAFIVGVFYCLDALHGERRDRSILFWKSLPVSDLTTLLSKATIPLVVLPLVTFLIVMVTQFVMLLWTSVLLMTHNMSPASTWTNVQFFQGCLILLYGLVAIALWHAPIYGWVLLVSGWARRATFLWAVVPLLAIGFFEKITFGTSHFASMLKDRLLGFAPNAFVFNQHSIASPQLTPLKYLSTPGLWIGLAFAAAFIAAAVWQRRYRGPI